MRGRLVLIFSYAALTLVISGCNGATLTSPTTASTTAFQLSLTPTTVQAGASSEGTVVLSSPALNAVQITLSSSDAVASVPPSVTVPLGTSSTTFKVTTRLVAADTTAKITASVGGVKQELTLRVISPVARPATLDTLDLDPSVVRAGQTAQGTVRLTGAAPQPGLSVNVRSSNSAAIVPATVTIQGGALGATFTIATRPVNLDTQFEITASYLDQTRTVPFRVTP